MLILGSLARNCNKKESDRNETQRQRGRRELGMWEGLRNAARGLRGDCKVAVGCREVAGREPGGKGARHKRKQMR